MKKMLMQWPAPQGGQTCAMALCCLLPCPQRGRTAAAPPPSAVLCGALVAARWRDAPASAAHGAHSTARCCCAAHAGHAHQKKEGLAGSDRAPLPRSAVFPAQTTAQIGHHRRRCCCCGSVWRRAAWRRQRVMTGLRRCLGRGRLHCCCPPQPRPWPCCWRRLWSFGSSSTPATAERYS